MRLSAPSVAFYGVFCAICLVLGYLEILFPLPVAIPGVKLGLGNIVVLITLALRGARPAFALMLFKVVSSALLFGNPAALPISLAGGLLSFAAMALVLGSGRFGVLAASALGGILHNVGQLLVVALLLGPAIAWASAPVLVVAGTVTGVLIGIVSEATLGSLGPRFRR